MTREQLEAHMDRSPVPTLDEDVFKGNNFRMLIEDLIETPMGKKAMAGGFESRACARTVH